MYTPARGYFHMKQYLKQSAPAVLFLFSATCSLAQTTAAAITCAPHAPPSQTEATRALAAADYGQAETLFTAQLAATPSEAAYAGLVQSQIELNKVTEALATAKQSVTAYPASAKTQTALGDAEFRASNLDAARDAYLAARKLDPCFARAHFGSARLLELSSMHASAQKELIFAHKLAVADSDISEALFATLPPALHAKGYRNLLASTPDMSVARRQRLEQEAALLEAGMTCVAQNPISRPTRVEFTPIQYGGDSLRDWALHASFGPKKSIDLEIDSTVSGIILSETAASRLAVTPAIPGQTKAPYLASVENLQLADLHFARCPVRVVPDAELPHSQSVIGTDFFRGSLINLNWAGRFMTLSPYTTASGAVPLDAAIPDSEREWAHVIVNGHRLLFATAINKQPTGLFLYDTAYSPTIISPPIAARLAPKPDLSAPVDGYSGASVRFFYKDGIPIDRPDILDTNGKLLKVTRPQTFTIFRFAGNEYPDKNTYTFDISGSSHAAGIEVAGIFGLTVMREYFTDIDYRNGLMQMKLDRSFYLRDGSPIH